MQSVLEAMGKNLAIPWLKFVLRNIIRQYDKGVKGKN